MVSKESDSPKFKVHVSYVGVDSGFVDKLVKGLKRDGRFQLSTSPNHKARNRNWKSVFGALIADADTILFVLSPDAARSKTFVWESEHAYELSKRMIPIVHRPMRNTNAPDQLATLKSMHFGVAGRSFDSDLQSIARRLLDIDADWLRMHTLLFRRAKKWKASKRSWDLLLTGAEVTAAKSWTFERPENGPKPTELHMTFIQASEGIETARRNGTLTPETDLTELTVLAQSNVDKKRSRRKSEFVGITSGEDSSNSRTEPAEPPVPTQLQLERRRSARRPAASEAAYGNEILEEQTEFAEHTAQLQLKKVPSPSRQSWSHPVLGSILVILATAAVWQAWFAVNQVNEEGRQTLIQMQFAKAPTKHLFVAQNKRIESVLNKAECLISQENEKGKKCVDHSE